MKLTIKNQTRWSTRELRKIIRAAVRENEITGDAIHVDVRYARGQHYGYPDVIGGNAGRTHVILKMPRGEAIDMARSMVVVEHEFYHTRLFRTIGRHTHRDFPRRILKWWEATGVPEWAAGLTLHHVEVPKKTRSEAAVSAVERREARARAHVERLEVEITRKQKLLKKWRDKVRYYDKRTAALSQPKP